MISAAVIVAACAHSHAQTVRMLSFQAHLRDQGAAFTGTVDLDFRVYTDAVGGSLVDINGDGQAVAHPLHDIIVVQDVSVVDGLLATKWGPISPKAFDGTPRWVEVRVDGQVLTRFELVTPIGTAEQLNAPDSGRPVAQTSTEDRLGVGTPLPHAKLEIVGGQPVTVGGQIFSTPNTTIVNSGNIAFLNVVKAGDIIVVNDPIPQQRMIVELVNQGHIEIESPFNPPINLQPLVVLRPVARVELNSGAGVMQVTPDGRVGIGTDIPETDFQVEGEMRTDQLSVTDLADINEIVGNWDQSASGYIRLGDVQIVWGSFTATTGNTPPTGFPASFSDTNYSITATPHFTAAGRMATIEAKTVNSAVIQNWRDFTEKSGTSGTYIAIGRWR